MRETLEIILDKYEKRYDLINQNLNLSNRFRVDIENIYQKTGKQVVVLVDEYGKPLLDTMEIDEEREEKNRQLYGDFFSALKDEDDYVRFVLITGVTKFAKVSIFSGMNQPRDISMSDEYASLCGITEEELNELFIPEIEQFAKVQDISEKECRSMLAFMYDGYHFSKRGEAVYNPYSLFNAFQDKDFGSYWFDTGAPTFLIHKLRNSDFSPEDFTDGVEISETQLPDYRPDNTNPIPLLFQTGYLTIYAYRKRIQPGNGIYTMKFPNKEVRTGFLEMLAPEVLGDRNTDDKRPYERMGEDIENGNIDSFMNRLKALFARIPYPDNHQKSYEWEWRNQVFMLFVLLGENVHAEVHSSYGRADCIVETENYVDLFEFKLDQSAEKALQQIDDKGYADAYLNDSRKVVRIGVSFSSEKRNIADWKIKAK